MHKNMAKKPNDYKTLLIMAFDWVFNSLFVIFHYTYRLLINFN